MFRDRLGRHLSALILAPTAAATLVFVYGFIAWTAYMSFTGSRMMPLYELVGFDAYTRLWQMERWHVSIVNLLIFGSLFVALGLATGLLLAILLDQRIRAEGLLRTEPFDVISLDLGLPDAQGLQAVARIQAEAPHIGFIVLSNSEDPELAIETVKAGAQDYLVKRRAGGTNIARSLRYAEQRKRAEQHLANIAFHDQLTGLANRNLFRQRVAKALANCRRADLPPSGMKHDEMLKG